MPGAIVQRRVSKASKVFLLQSYHLYCVMLADFIPNLGFSFAIISFQLRDARRFPSHNGEFGSSIQEPRPCVLSIPTLSDLLLFVIFSVGTAPILSGAHPPTQPLVDLLQCAHFLWSAYLASLSFFDLDLPLFAIFLSCWVSILSNLFSPGRLHFSLPRDLL